MENFQNKEEIIQEEPNQKAPGENSLRPFIWFAIILCIAIGTTIVWKGYLSPDAQYIRESQKNYESYKKIEDAYLKALREDTYGGKTPQETLSMFVEALKKGDVELASKYFIQEKNLDSRKWTELLNKIKGDGNIEKFAKDIEKFDEAKETFDPYYLFIYKNEDGSDGLQITMILNKEANIWKIESL